MNFAIQLAASLAAILALAGVARWLKLGGDVRIRDEAHARELAEQLVCGFTPQAVALDRARIGALMRDAQGRHLLIRRHGALFAGRLLDGHHSSRLDRNFLTIGTGERMFGTITLDLGEAAQSWAAGLRRVGRA